MKWMMVLAGLMPAMATAAEIEMKATNATPFAISVLDAGEEQGYAVVSARVVNNSSSRVAIAKLHCLLRNAEGQTWHARGQVANLASKETRTVRITGSVPLDDYTRNPTLVHCRATGFEAPDLQAD